MGSMGSLDLLEELTLIARHLSRNPTSKAFRAISDLAALIVATSFGSPNRMFEELIVRDNLEKLDDELLQVFSENDE